MALPAPALTTFKATEIAFRAEDEPITIIPKQSLAPLKLAGWETPALRPMRRVDVPLWLALLLKKQDRCSIVFPDWLSETNLKALVDQERTHDDRFAAVPWLWQPVSHALLARASDDLAGSVDAVRELLQDLRELRQTKIRAGVAQVNDSHVQMDGLGLMEINEIRPVLSRSMATLQKVRTSTT